MQRLAGMVGYVEDASQPGGPGGPADDGKRLGLSEAALDVAWYIDKILFTRGGCPGEGWCRDRPDDRKRLELSEFALDVASR